MIFKTEAENFHLLESYKERNLYYKIFAGYFLNEIIEGYDDRKKHLLEILMRTSKDEQRFKGPLNKAQIVFEALALEKEWNITFDYHIKQFSPSIRDHGEMSDMLLLTRSSMVSLECKFNCNICFEKDVLEVQERIKYFKVERTALQVLLLKQAKWNEMKRHQRQRGSVYSKFQQMNLEIPVIVVFWEDLLPLIKEDKVINYLKQQLVRV